MYYAPSSTETHYLLRIQSIPATWFMFQYHGPNQISRTTHSKGLGYLSASLENPDVDLVYPDLPAFRPHFV